jgi:uncharacterized protein YbjT (DUF2867 family)
MALSGQRVLLAGATGLVGGLALDAVLARRDFHGRVVAPVRRPLAPPEARPDARLVAPVCDFGATGADEQLAAAVDAAGARPLDAYVCCLGTTLRAAGSRAAFIAVDRDLVLRLAQLARGLGARHAVLVSSVGASRQSGTFYLRVKGEVEDAMASLGFERLDILQPGLLVGPRRERRPAEALAQRLVPLADPLLLGRLRDYRSIPATVVAGAIVALLDDGGAAARPAIHTHADLRALAEAQRSKGTSAGST